MCHQTKLDVTVKKSITVKTTSNRLVIDQRSQGITGYVRLGARLVQARLG